jgi:hypothetical protein
MSRFDCAEGMDKAHAHEPDKNRTLCGQVFIKSTGMEWFSEEEIALIPGRPCKKCIELVRKHERTTA